jgi:hypothetical protein
MRWGKAHLPEFSRAGAGCAKLCIPDGAGYNLADAPSGELTAFRRNVMRQLSITANDIEATYSELGHQWGWSFLGAPEAQLYTAETVIVGLNPARGKADSPSNYGSHWDVPEGNIYFSKNWGGGEEYTRLQHQLLIWHELLQLGPTQTIGANFVPFRSRSWSKLRHPKESILFAERLWQDVVTVAPAHLFLTMGKDAARYLARALNAKSPARLPTEWGKQTIDVYNAPGGRRIVAMPHPSRFGLFGRGELSKIAEASLVSACGAEAGP